MGKKKTSGGSSAPPAAPFQFAGGFSVGTGSASEGKLPEPPASSAVAKTKLTISADADDEDEEEDEEGDDDEDDNGLIDLASLPKDVRKRVSALLTIHDDHKAIQDEYKKARIDLERAFQERRAVLYAARKGIVTGAVEVPDPPVAEGAEAAEEAEEEDSTPQKGIPSFWASVLNSHPQIGPYITDEDADALDSLTDITCEYKEDYTSFTLSFHFAENEYFIDKVITKTYHLSPDLLDDGSPSLKSCEGCDISWKPGKNLCVEEISKKQRAKSGRNKGQVRVIKVQKPKASFFQFFYPKTRDELAEEDEEDEEGGGKGKGDDAEDFKIDPEEDYDIGHAIRTMLIPDAIRWFTGEAALEYDAMYADYFGDEEDDEEEDEEGDEGDEEEEEEVEEEKPKARPGKQKGSVNNKSGGRPVVGDANSPAALPAGGAAGTEEKPAECKQN